MRRTREFTGGVYRKPSQANTEGASSLEIVMSRIECYCLTRTMSTHTLRPNTLTALPLPTPAAALGVLLFALMRVFFLVFPNAFIAYPETQVEYNLYKQDLRCKAQPPVAQVIIQGTSRLELIQKLPLFEKRWHTKDRMANLSQPLNTFWHMNLLHRRNPGLLNSTEFWIIDVLPVQTRVSLGFNEHDTLFLRESTVAEKLRIRDTADRVRALADVVLPLWSQHHNPANWVRALWTLGASAQERLDTLMAIDGKRLPDITGARSAFPQEDMELVKEIFARFLYTPDRPDSEVQFAAYRELLARRPPSTQLWFIHPPYRTDFARFLDDAATQTSIRDMRQFIEGAAADSIHVEWLDTPDELGFASEDFAPDGVHASFSGIGKLEKYFAQRYRKWVPLAPEDAQASPK